jgi:hypothetical protein
VNLNDRPTYRLVLATDIEAFSRRNAEQQQRAQARLCRALDSAAARAGLDRTRWSRQNRGDGELAVLPECDDITQVVGDLVSGLETALGVLNRTCDHGQRLRVRLALHHGTLTDGPLGPVGGAPIVTSHLVDLEAGRRHLRMHQHRDVTVIVSASLYRDVISTGFCSMDPDDFEPFHAMVKEIPYAGFLYPKRPAGAVGAAPALTRPPRRAHDGRRLKTIARFPRATASRAHGLTPPR